jgi:hypothetical protein
VASSCRRRARSTSVWSRRRLQRRRRLAHHGPGHVARQGQIRLGRGGFGGCVGQPPFGFDQPRPVVSRIEFHQQVALVDVLVLTDMHRHDLPGDARADLHDISVDKGVIGGLIALVSQVVNAERHRGHHDQDDQNQSLAFHTNRLPPLFTAGNPPRVHRRGQIQSRDMILREAGHQQMAGAFQRRLCVDDLHVVSHPALKAVPGHLQFAFGERDRLLRGQHLLLARGKIVERKAHILFDGRPQIVPLHLGLPLLAGGGLHLRARAPAVEYRDLDADPHAARGQVGFVDLDSARPVIAHEAHRGKAFGGGRLAAAFGDAQSVSGHLQIQPVGERLGHGLAGVRRRLGREAHGLGQDHLAGERRTNHAQQIQARRIKAGLSLGQLHLLARQPRLGARHVDARGHARLALAAGQFQQARAELRVGLRRHDRLFGFQHRQVGQRRRRGHLLHGQAPLIGGQRHAAPRGAVAMNGGQVENVLVQLETRVETVERAHQRRKTRDCADLKAHRGQIRGQVHLVGRTRDVRQQRRGGQPLLGAALHGALLGQPRLKVVANGHLHGLGQRKVKPLRGRLGVRRTQTESQDANQGAEKKSVHEDFSTRGYCRNQQS